MFSRLRHWSHHMLARLPSLLPCSCALCGRTGETAVCEGCHEHFFATSTSRCSQCAIPLPEHHASTCGDCLNRSPAFDATIVATDYAAPVDQMVLALKFGNRLELAPLFAQKMRDALLRRRSLALPTILTAVPLGRIRLAERGFNQALEIAKPLSQAIGVRLDPHLVVRQRDTRAQAMLHPDERHRNIRNAFLVSPTAMDRLQGQHVGIVDDVMTTGETLNELAMTLKRFGAARVTNFVFARTAHH